MTGKVIRDEYSEELALKLEQAVEGDEPVKAHLGTDEKVIARITDGIYRQPASALRELISNAYDADATTVSIQTDYPRFERITIRDNGNGMGEKALANLIHHIGGSAKRDPLGMSIGVTNQDDSTLTVGGRKIIGKIGIGLFSVAQLTQQFQIITKVKGNNYRLVADVTLKTYTEDEILDNPDADRFESGYVEIKKVKAADIDSHGTDIVLMNLRKNALAILRSDDIWSKAETAETEKDKESYKPTYHIGRYSQKTDGTFEQVHDMSLPWRKEESPKDRFTTIYSSILDEIEYTRSTPRLDNTFDNYFQTIWNLALSSPINYIEKHPFLLDDTDEPIFFSVSNSLKEQSSDLVLSKRTYRDVSETIHPIDDPAGGFDVFVDGIKLYRPIAFNKQKKSQNALKDPLMFYGRYSAPLSKTDKSITGGDLEFEAYFYWNSKILPQEHNGILVRINEASGTLFDSRWLGYPVAERTTLGQITAEVFINKGMDSALNIDRESFNYSHPHYQILSKWVHNALRQITAKQKKLRAERNKEKKQVALKNALKGLNDLPEVAEVLTVVDSLPEFDSDRSRVENYRTQGVVSFVSGDVLPDKISELNLEKLKLILAILDVNGMISGMSYTEQEQIVKSIAVVLNFGDQ